MAGVVNRCNFCGLDCYDMEPCPCRKNRKVMKQNKLQRADAFKVYEWLKAKKEEIEAGKFTRQQLAQACGEHIGVLVGVNSIDSVMRECGITFKHPKCEKKPPLQVAKLEARIANIERQLGITNVDS